MIRRPAYRGLPVVWWAPIYMMGRYGGKLPLLFMDAGDVPCGVLELCNHARVGARGLSRFALATFHILVLDGPAVLLDKAFVPVGCSLDFFCGGVALHDAAHEFEGSECVIAACAVGSDIRCALSPCDSLEIARVPFVLALLDQI